MSEVTLTQVAKPDPELIAVGTEDKSGLIDFFAIYIFVAIVLVTATKLVFRHYGILQGRNEKVVTTIIVVLFFTQFVVALIIIIASAFLP